MESRAIVCLCVVLLGVGVVHGQVASICRPRERLLMCGGCQKTCLNPVQECKGVCKPGCYCADDEVRNATGHCVKLSECPPLPVSYKQDTTEPRPADAKCPDNEEYRFCETCNRTCDNPNPICPAQCARGCFCVGDLVRDRDGRCVKREMCSNTSSNEISYNPLLDKPVHEKKCGKNQVFKGCEVCERTCRRPKTPECVAPCRPGCFCDDGFYKAPSGECVALDQCPKVQLSQTSEVSCGRNQVFKPCENCEKTCSSPNPICPAQCTRGCFCKDGLYKAPNGECVTLDKCPQAVSTTPTIPHRTPIAYEMTCSPNQVFKSCENCEKTCSNPNPICPAQCTRGCFCKDGLFKAPNGACVKLENCPKAEISMGAAHETTIEDCDADEEFYSCGWCEPSCSDPEPECPLKVCTRGCLCRPPLLRHRSGHCVERKNCAGPKCPPNEEYVCRYGCEASCSMRPCVLRPRRCRLACHCLRGLLRDSTGLCVTPDRC